MAVVTMVVWRYRDSKRGGDKYFNLIKPNVVPDCRRSTKIEIVGGGEDEERGSGMISCWQTSQAFQLSHIVRKVRTWSVDHGGQKSTPF